MGNEENKFLNAYEENAKIQTEQVMETSQIAVCLAHFVDTDPRFNGHAMVRDLEGRPLWGWTGVASSLKGELEVVAEQLNIDTKSNGWPRNPSWLIRRINEIRHTLKAAGIEIEYDQRNAKSRIIMIRKLVSLPSLPSQDENHDQKETQNSDAINDGKDDINKMTVTKSRSKSRK